MRYVKVAWHHDHPDEPLAMFSECDDAGWELRKVEVFRDGRLGWASRDGANGDTWLSVEPLPPLHTIANDPQFQPSEITREEFEHVWHSAQPVAA